MTPLQAAEEVRLRLRENGYLAFLVGGCVRDLLLGRQPKDYDITTDATPQQVMEIFPKTIPVGAAFGVVIVVEAGIQIEVATFRADGDYTDGRRPDTVSYSKEPIEDVVRRDFTINGLLSVGSVNPENVAEYEATLRDATDRVTIGDQTYGIVDFVDGIADLDAKIIRCIGNPEDRFKEDALRMLRAVRFAAQLGFEIEEKTFNAIQTHAERTTMISRERIAMELFKLVTAPFPVEGLLPFVTTGLIDYVLPSLGYEGNFITTLRRFTKFPTTDSLKGMAMLLAEHEYETVVYVVERLKLSNEQAEVITNALKYGNRIGNLDILSLAEIKRLARIPGILIGVDLFEQEVAILGQVFNPQMQAAIDRLRNFTHEDIYPQPLITGDDLIEMGLKPGPSFTTLLGAVETQQLNGNLVSAEEAKKFILEQLTPEGANGHSA